MLNRKCIICGTDDKPGLSLEYLQGEPFFCQRCLFLILMNGRDDILSKYCKGLTSYDDMMPILAPENIWKEVK